MCANFDGSFKCSCHMGYTLTADNLACNGKECSDRLNILSSSCGYPMHACAAGVGTCHGVHA